jgi:hypothetical protein
LAGYEEGAGAGEQAARAAGIGPLTGGNGTGDSCDIQSTAKLSATKNDQGWQPPAGSNSRSHGIGRRVICRPFFTMRAIGFTLLRDSGNSLT